MDQAAILDCVDAMNAADEMFSTLLAIMFAFGILLGWLMPWNPWAWFFNENRYPRGLTK
ncbi:hypothetical protein [Methylomonas sp. UP202]|uniref:hypothetical protein n=1 Tax=Methylomonas sp. UP202 TaxID=3040943 RepID=UPI00247AFE2B|nr:hypothetical protein [Methylomonas sp. UP202]WGS84978.1 hypothetical protein QC632_18265 [Methylomonas sp. UP202]